MSNIIFNIQDAHCSLKHMKLILWMALPSVFFADAQLSRRSLVSIGSGDAGTLLWCENTLGDQGAIKLGSMHLPCIRRWTCNCKFLPKDNQHQQLYTILLSSMKCTFIQDKNMNHGNRKEVGHSSVSWMQKETTSTKGHYLKIPPLYTEDKTVLIWPCGIPRSNCLLVAGHHPVVTSPSTREETKIDCLDSKWGERGWASIRINVSKICGRCCPLLCVLLCYVVLLCFCVSGRLPSLLL